MRALVLSAAIAALAVAGSARAEPVALPSDQLDDVTAGSGYFPPINLQLAKNVAVNVHKNIAVKALLVSLPVVKGNLAEAQAFATAIGKGSFSQTLTSSEAVQDVYARSGSESVSAANGPHYHPGRGHPPRKPPCRC